MMARQLWRGTWYVFNYVRKEFVRYFATRRVYYTPAMKYAKIYKNPHNAMRAAEALNRSCGRYTHQALPENAAWCLDQMNMRESEEEKGD